ncbi:MAG TPA: hypothetical protein VEA69_23450 [Tepidisphaeraceae bacterium]|nr:hypothetical protein [Tepidisphaeraceae bacterium]
MTHRTRTTLLAAIAALALSIPAYAADEKPKKPAKEAKADTAKAEAKPAKPRPKTEKDVPYPPTLPDGKTVLTDTSPDFLKAPETLRPGVTVAKTAPTVDFMFFPGQDYPGKPWSNWGDGVAANGKYYSAIGDHLAPAGNAFVFEYDPIAKSLRQLVDVKKTLNLPEGHYAPAKIHSRVDIGADGWLYYSTHRGSPKATTDANHYKGDWVLRTDPKTAKTEVVAHGPVPKHCIPNSVLDPDNLIFYGGTAAGQTDGEDKDIQFFAWDVKNKKLLYSGGDGPSRYMIFAKSTGRLYYVPGNAVGQLLRFDPKSPGKPTPVPNTEIGVRAATQETPQGIVYTSSQGKGAGASESTLYAFDVKTETTKALGPVAVGTNTYVASIDADPTGRYLYYIPGAHGGSERDNSAVIQYDTKTNTKKVIAFLHPYYQDKYGFTLKGTYSTAVDPAGDKLYVTWNVSRGTKAWDCTGITCIHIPESERPQ